MVDSPDVSHDGSPDRAADTRARILEAARELFARRGFDGTSVRDITAAADVNLAAVRYHFQGKEPLYHAVLGELVGPLAQGIARAAAMDAPPLDRIETVVRATFAHFRANPDMPAIVVREMASGAQIAAPILSMMQSSIPLLAGIIAAGQREGTIRAGDPMLLALSTIAQPVYLNLARRAIAAAAGVDQDDPATFERVTNHAVQTVRASLVTHSN